MSTNGTAIEASSLERPWAISRDEDPSAALMGLQKEIPVRLIATPRRSLFTCREDEPVHEVWDRNIDKFDFVPVEREAEAAPGHLVGLLRLSPPPVEQALHSFAKDVMETLFEGNLIGADASILAFVRDADRRPCRLVVSETEIMGLVSLSDLQRLPVRAALFAVVTHLEMMMADAIAREWGKEPGWLNGLSEDRQRKIREEARLAGSENFVAWLLFTQFGDKVTIIRKSPRFIAGRNGFERDMTHIQRLRDNLAHANEYAATRLAAEGVCATVRLIDHWSKALAAWPGRK